MAAPQNPGTPTAANPSNKVMTGARALISVNGQLCGLFESCSYNVSVGVEPIHILGAYGPVEITPTSYEAVTLNCSGFRIINQGAQVLPAFPTIGDLLALEGMVIQVTDRQTGIVTMSVMGCVGTTLSGNFNARATSKINITYTGLVYSEDGNADGEGNNAAQLP